MICNVTIRFIVDSTNVDMSRLCSNLETDAVEKCFNCSHSLENCIVQDDAYGLRFWFNGVSRFVNFYNFAASCNVVDYELECSELYWHNVKPSQMIADRSLLIKLATRVSEQLGFTDFVLLPFLIINTW